METVERNFTNASQSYMENDLESCLGLVRDIVPVPDSTIRKSHNRSVKHHSFVIFISNLLSRFSYNDLIYKYLIDTHLNPLITLQHNFCGIHIAS
jgi:hypothetical protein